MQDDSRFVSAEEASAVWQRAARLQAEAARLLEDRSRQLAARAGVDPGADEGGDYRIADVRSAAVEAGIAPEFVALALAENASPDADGPGSPRRDALAGRLLGTDRRSLEVVRAIAGTPEEVFEAMQRVLPAHPFLLTLSDTVGDPLGGGVLVFDLPGLTATGGGGPFAYHAAAVDVKHLRFVLRRAPGGDGCELSVAADLRRSVRRNGVAAIASGGVAGLGAGAMGGAVGLGILALGALAVLPAAGAAALAGAAGAFGYGRLYRHYLGKFVADMEGLLRAVDVNARTRGAFSPPTPRVPEPPIAG
jgi:eukaryotic-like serine/threonine-protein kinase